MHNKNPICWGLSAKHRSECPCYVSPKIFAPQRTAARTEDERMTKQEAIEKVQSYGESDGPKSYHEAAELFEAIFDRQPDADDGDAGELFSHVCAAV